MASLAEFLTEFLPKFKLIDSKLSLLLDLSNIMKTAANNTLDTSSSQYVSQNTDKVVFSQAEQQEIRKHGKYWNELFLLLVDEMDTCIMGNEGKNVIDTHCITF